MQSPEYRRGLQRVVDGFRNAAAHDKSLSAGECNEAIGLLLGSEHRAGLLEQTAIAGGAHAPVPPSVAPSRLHQRARDHWFTRLHAATALVAPEYLAPSGDVPEMERYEEKYALFFVSSECVVMAHSGAAARVFVMGRSVKRLLQWGLERKHVRALARAVSRRHIDFSAKEFEVHSAKGGDTLTLRFLTQEPGIGWYTLSLDASQRQRCIDAILRIEGGEFGDVGNRIETSSELVMGRVVGFLGVHSDTSGVYLDRWDGDADAETVSQAVEALVDALRGSDAHERDKELGAASLRTALRVARTMRDARGDALDPVLARALEDVSGQVHLVSAVAWLYALNAVADGIPTGKEDVWLDAMAFALAPAAWPANRVPATHRRRLLAAYLDMRAELITEEQFLDVLSRWIALNVGAPTAGAASLTPRLRFALRRHYGVFDALIQAEGWPHE